MTGIVLSASVRQNLLSLQSTADLLSTTQNRLATGNKVNSAIANQVLQTTVGYSTKASATTTVGAVGSAADLTTGGTTTLQGKTVIFTPATGSALTLTFSNVAGAG